MVLRVCLPWLIVIRYFLITGGAYWLFYSLLKQSVAKRGSHRSPPLGQSIRRDIQLSVLSAVVFALGAAFVMTEYDLGKTLLYADLRQSGLWYLGASFVAVLIVQDAFFYFIHRVFHHPSLFKWTHLGFELFRASFPRHWLGWWFIGSTHHSLHHRKYTVYYGLYFTFWDKWLGTDDPNYENEFDLALRR